MKNHESFFARVYRVVKKIPPGRVTSYGAIAEYLGTKGSARMVGWAMNASHTETYNIPAHRVVNRDGMLTGKHHFGGPRIMQQLLESEGIRVTDDRVAGFKKIFWDPMKELKTSTGQQVNRLKIPSEAGINNSKIRDWSLRFFAKFSLRFLREPNPFFSRKDRKGLRKGREKDQWVGDPRRGRDQRVNGSTGQQVNKSTG
jgi:methylated-DNA-protein-cysteine methyltransferase-like protein